MSRLPEAVRKQAEAANAMLLANGNTDQSAVDLQEAAPIATGTPDIPTPDQSNSNQADTQLDKPLGNDEDRWEQRYKILQGKYNKEVPALHDQIKALRQQIGANDPGEVITLRSEIADLKRQLEVRPAQQTPLSTPDIEKLREDFPAELVDGLLSVVRGMIDPVAQRVESVDKTVARSSQDTRVDRLRSLLRESSIDYDQVNTDPLFVNDFLSQIDNYSGENLHALLTKAFNEGNIARTAKFFIDYATGAKTQTSRATDSRPGLDRHVSLPGTSAPDNLGTGEKRWSDLAIAEFYDKKRRGLYTKAQADALEREIFASM